MTLGERIKQARNHAGLTQRAVARHFGIQKASVTQWESGRTNPDTKKLGELARILGVSVEWLLTGDSVPYVQLRNVLPADEDRTAVPVIDFVSAGRWGEIAAPDLYGHEAERMFTDLKVSVRAFGLIIAGTSMEPEFRDGDKIIIDPAVNPRPGDYVVAKLDATEEATFKRYRPRGVDRNGVETIELVPLNPDWPTLVINAENPGRIIGTMVEHRRFRRDW